MDLTVKPEQYSKDAWIVYLKGSMDSSNSSELSHTLFELIQDKWIRHLLLNMKEVKYLSSSGIGVMLVIHKKIKELNGTFGIYDPTLSVQRVLEIVKWDFLNFLPDQIDSSHPFYSYIQAEELKKAKEKEIPNKK